MKDALQLKIKGIKCDVCDYKNENVEPKEYEEWINKPCPKCGANLLTQEDYDTTMALIKITETLNKILPKAKDDEEIVTASVEMNGTGTINFKIKK